MEAGVLAEIAPALAAVGLSAADTLWLDDATGLWVRSMPGSGNLPSTALTTTRRPVNLGRSGEDPVELVVDGRDRAVGPFRVDQRLHHESIGKSQQTDGLQCGVDARGGDVTGLLGRPQLS